MAGTLVPKDTSVPAVTMTYYFIYFNMFLTVMILYHLWCWYIGQFQWAHLWRNIPFKGDIVFNELILLIWRKCPSHYNYKTWAINLGWAKTQCLVIKTMEGLLVGLPIRKWGLYRPSFDDREGKGLSTSLAKMIWNDKNNVDTSTWLIQFKDIVVPVLSIR